MTGFSLLALYCLAIIAASLLGGYIPLWIKLTHTRMQLAVSLVAGFMLGVGLLHLLPHALEVGHGTAIHGEHMAGQVIPVYRLLCSLLVGFLAMFFVERFFCFHHHDVPGDRQKDVGPKQDNGQTCCGSSEPYHAHDHKLTWSGAAVGLTLHSLLAGVALAASMQGQHADPAAMPVAGQSGAALPGLAVFLVILLHKPFDSMTLITLMNVGRWPRLWQHGVNIAFALVIPLGALLFYLGLSLQEGQGDAAMRYALAFSAGTFLCVSTSDLLPELQFHHHDRIKLSVALLIGLGLAGMMAWVQPH